MKRAPKIALLLLSPLLCCFQCEKEDLPLKECDPTEIQTLTTQEVSPVFIEPQSGTQQGTRLFQVNSFTELAAAVPSAQLGNLPIDFSRYTLLGGVSVHSSGISIRPQLVTLDCNGIYTYSAKLEDGPILRPTALFFGVLVPKLPQGANVLFDLHAYE